MKEFSIIMFHDYAKLPVVALFIINHGKGSNAKDIGVTESGSDAMDKKHGTFGVVDK